MQDFLEKQGGNYYSASCKTQEATQCMLSHQLALAIFAWIFSSARDIPLAENVWPRYLR